LNLTVKESRELDRVVKLFEQHEDTSFAYLANIPLVKTLSQLESFKIFVAEVNGETVGCIHSLCYIHDCGHIEGLLVHKDFREKGVGSRLLNAALNSLSARCIYLFVEEGNIAAIRLVEKTGFKRAYRGRYCIASTSLAGASGGLDITNDVDLASLKERSGVVNLGYYPVKTTQASSRI